ncbi:MAG: hypothetical protein Hals2KO_01790 [Halioglobus sp.]
MPHRSQAHRAQVPIAAVALYLVMSVTDVPTGFAHGALLFACLYATLFPVLPQHSSHRSPSPSLPISLALFLTSFAASTWFSYYRPLSIDTVANLVPGLLVLYVLIRTRATVSTCTDLCALFAGAVGATYLLTGFRSGWMDAETAMHDFRISALVVPNDVMATVILLPVLLMVVLKPRTKLARTGALFMLCALLPLWGWVGSRLSVLVLLLTAAAYSVYSARVRLETAIKGIAVISILLLCAGLALLAGWVDVAQLPALDNTRLSVWAAGISRWNDNPWFGFGPGHFEVPYRLGIAELRLPDWIMVEERMVPWAHNIYLESYLERGAFGLATQVLLFTVLYRVLLEKWQSARGADKGHYLAMLLAYCAFLFAGLFELTFQRLWVANLLFLLVAAAALPSRTFTKQAQVPQ